MFPDTVRTQKLFLMFETMLLYDTEIFAIMHVQTVETVLMKDYQINPVQHSRDQSTDT